jgi:hypothetical protein
VSGYAAGRGVEYAVIHDLQDNGYYTIRAASSKGLADVVAVKEGQVCFVNVKKTTPPGPGERRQLLNVARCIPDFGIALVALGPASRITYRQLTGTSPKAWIEWHPDFVEAS